MPKVVEKTSWALRLPGLRVICAILLKLWQIVNSAEYHYPCSVIATASTQANHADVLKHTVQSLIIESLKEKDKPFLYLDTHAGAGRYQLSGEHAERTGEYLEGIARVSAAGRSACRAGAAHWRGESLQPQRPAALLPGSPLIACQRAACASRTAFSQTELHPSDSRCCVLSFRKITAPAWTKPMATSS